jgi:hypothetical protein
MLAIGIAVKRREKIKNSCPLVSMFPFSTVAADTESREVNRFPLPNNTTTATTAVTEEKAE